MNRAGIIGWGRQHGTELAALVLGAALTAGCSSKPPPDFAPDPSLVDRISEIRMHTEGSWACPGNTIRGSYEAVLDDGSVVPFATKYDDDYPPALHVVFLRRTSREASPRRDGGWDTEGDPLISVLDGFRLNAFLLAKPSLNVSGVVKPEYSCLRHAFSFVGRGGGRGQGGGPGPDVTVRLDVMSSPFYEALLVGGIQVGNAPPFYVLADAAMVPPADWLMVESKGGPGGRGVDGAEGVEGAKGSDGCPAGAGGAGGRGGNGGAGGPGGPGGRTTVIVPSEQPLLAGMVDANSSGGVGGKGGRAGKGGDGGDGGRGIAGTRRCANGQQGPEGEDGAVGPAGPEGSAGPRAQVITVPAAELFMDPRIMPLVEYNRSGRK
ncbi:MAG: hypothetical protein JSW71_18525 [Gemmatimonadota bacterium]|nr:MAG: hypothetical protein JSW71_18525 [Gemmatimonadota bacterium]